MLSQMCEEHIHTQDYPIHRSIPSQEGYIHIVPCMKFDRKWKGGREDVLFMSSDREEQISLHTESVLIFFNCNLCILLPLLQVRNVVYSLKYTGEPFSRLWPLKV